jgi:CRISPR-associated endonuclease/helicase Cas3
LAANQSGYDPERGFVAGEKRAVTPVPPSSEEGESEEDYGSDHLTRIGRWVTLAEHLRDVGAAADQLARALNLPDALGFTLGSAARWHDVGKAHEAFQRGIAADSNYSNGPWAKSGESRRPDYHMVDAHGNKQRRPYFRHELVSALAWLEHGGSDRGPVERDLIAYLIASHHGRVRLGLRALPVEPEPPGDPDRFFARGVWAGDLLPAVNAGEVAIPETVLRLDLMKLGEGAQGPSWTERTRRLLERHGPFALAWCEALVRIADWRASAMERAR